MAALITAAFVEARMGESLDATETIQVEAFIDDASAEILLVGDPDWTSVTVPDSVKSVVFQMVRRAFTNPDSLRAENIGDYSYRRDDNVTDGGVYLTFREYAKVRRAAGKANVRSVGARRSDEYERNFVKGVWADDGDFTT